MLKTLFYYLNIEQLILDKMSSCLYIVVLTTYKKKVKIYMYFAINRENI